ncbi:MAG: hypothetical protein QG665_465 [Patescibacteria group bacterium]|nr:hypothetical protein [Patescibacteria group bacterium]
MKLFNLKNIGIGILFLCLGAGSVLAVTPNIVQAQDADSSRFIICGQDGDTCNFNDLKKLVNIVIEFVIFELSMPIAVIAIMYAGALLVLKGDKPGERTKAYSLLKNIGIGLVLMLAAYIIIKAVVVGLVGTRPANEVGQSLIDLFRQ